MTGGRTQDGRGDIRVPPFSDLADRIVACERCPRLRGYCREIARVKRRAYRDETYWGRPLPGFGDPAARLFILGLAPAAHGANRTGRMFTGDSSGSWLYAALHAFGWSNLANSLGRDDGLRLTGAYIAAAARCAPPANKPTPAELANCRPYLVEELANLEEIRVVLCLGRIAFDAYLRALENLGTPWPRPRPAFRHGGVSRSADARHPILVASYHPSRQNTNTGRLTRAMWNRVFAKCRALVDERDRRR